MSSVAHRGLATVGGVLPSRGVLHGHHNRSPWRLAGRYYCSWSDGLSPVCTLQQLGWATEDFRRVYAHCQSGEVAWACLFERRAARKEGLAAAQDL